MIAYDAIVVAGGRGSRLGGVRKPELTVGGRRLVDIALAAVASARRVVVVGDIEVPDGVLRTREDPPWGGPVAAVEAGMAELTRTGGHAAWTLLLAADLPDAPAAVAELLAAPAWGDADADGVCLLDDTGRLQWLLGGYRTPTLRRRLAERGDPPLTAMWRLLEPLRLVGVRPAVASTDDVDTPADVVRWDVRPADPRPRGDIPCA